MIAYGSNGTLRSLKKKNIYKFVAFCDVFILRECWLADSLDCHADFDTMNCYTTSSMKGVNNAVTGLVVTYHRLGS